MITSTSVRSKKFERKLIDGIRHSIRAGYSVVLSEKQKPLFEVVYYKKQLYVSSWCNTNDRDIVRAIQRAKPFQAIRHRLVPWDSRPVGRMV